MSIIREEEALEFNFPHIKIYKTYLDNAFSSYRARPEQGYRMYDPNARDFELDPNTLEEYPITIYYPIAGFPKDYNFDRFPYVAEKKA